MFRHIANLFRKIFTYPAPVELKSQRYVIPEQPVKPAPAQRAKALTGHDGHRKDYKAYRKMRRRMRKESARRNRA